MPLTLRMRPSDVNLTEQVLRALVAKPDVCTSVLFAANITRYSQKEAVESLVRIAAYMETVRLAQ